jgi:hypothetical protein
MMESGIGILAFILLAGGGIITGVVCLTVDKTVRAGSSR